MSLTKIGSIGINTGIAFAGVTTITTLNGSDAVLSVGGTVNFVSDVSIGGTVSIAGTLTYEDVTNVDAVGLITARDGIKVGSGITLSVDGDIFATGVTTATTFSGSGASLTDLNASNIASGTVPTARLGSGTASSSTFLRGDSTFQVVNTDLVSDTSPQLGGLLDGNGQTANFTANNTGLGIPIGTDANEPSAGSYKGYIRYNDDDDVIYYSNGTSWLKISTTSASLDSVSGSLYAGAASTLTLAGSGFLSGNLVVNFVQSSDSIDTNITVTPSSDTAATVTVTSAIYDNVTAGNAVTIKVTNSDGRASGTQNVTATALPSGGTITSAGGFRIHSFTSSGNFVNTVAGLAVEYLIVAGGGGGATDRDVGGGGGAGGVLSGTSSSTNAATHSVTVGAGGAGGTNSYNPGTGDGGNGSQGGNSSVFSQTAIGGGYGGTRYQNGGNGGSGGGGGDGAGSGGSGTSGQGYDGGDAPSMNANGGHDQGGGGGAGGAANAWTPGVGITSSFTGSSVTYATGGIGFDPGHPSGGANWTTASPNTGNGGRGSNSSSESTGGSGIVILRYVLS